MGPRDQVKTVFSLLIKQKGAPGCLWAGEPQGPTGVWGRSLRLALPGGGGPRRGRNRQGRGRGRRRPARLSLSPRPAPARPLLRSSGVRVRGLPREQAPLPAPRAGSAHSPTAAGRAQRLPQQRRTVIARRRQAGARSALAPTTVARGAAAKLPWCRGGTHSPEERP